MGRDTHTKLGLFLLAGLGLMACDSQEVDSRTHDAAFDELFSTSAAVSGQTPLATRSRPVEIDASLLAGDASPWLGQETASLIRLNLFDNATFNAVRTQTIQAENGAISWMGTLEQDLNSDVALTLMGDRVVGNIRAGQQTYQIRPDRNGQHWIHQVDLSALPAGAPPASPPQTHDRHQAMDDHDDHTPSTPTAVGADADDGSLIDVLVIVTGEAVMNAGGSTNLEAEINLAISEANYGYQQSNVSHRLRLVGFEETPWNERAAPFSFSSTLGALANPSDSVMDDVHSRRDAVGADLTVLIVEGDDSYCGIGYLMTTPSPLFQVAAFSVVARECAAGNYSFAHEIGHNMGSNHDHENASTGAYPYSYGLKDADAGFRTIMAYSCASSYCPRVNRWSNPSLNWEDTPTGVEGTGTDAADNHTSLNQTALIVAGFREQVDTTAPTAARITSPVEATQLEGSRALFHWEDVSADQTALTIGSTLGASDLGEVDMGSKLRGWVRGLPQDGRTLHVRLWTRVGDDWLSHDHRYIAADTAVEPKPAVLTSPTAGATLTGSTTTFTWTPQDASQVVIRLGLERDGSDLGQYAVGSRTSLTVHHIPTSGQTIWVTLYSHIDGTWHSQSSHFNAANDPSSDTQDTTDSLAAL